VAFASNLNGTSQTNGLNLFVARTDGSSLRQLTFDEAGVTNFSLSADGMRIAYTQSGRVYLVSTDGSQLPVGLTNLRQSAISDVVISDDGSRVVFTVGPTATGKAAIGSIAPEGSNLQVVYAPRSINPGGIAGLGNNVSPSPGSFFSVYGTNFAPDG